MKNIFFFFLILAAGRLMGQNTTIPVNTPLAQTNNSFAGNNPQQQINIVNTDDHPSQQWPQGDIEPGNVEIQQVVQLQQVVINTGTIFNQKKTAQNSNPPVLFRGQSGGTVSGYSGSSGAKHHAKKTVALKYKKAYKIFERKYKAPKHYGKRSRIMKCHGF